MVERVVAEFEEREKAGARELAYSVGNQRAFNIERNGCDMCHQKKPASAQRKVFTTPLLAEANKRRNTKQFTKKKSHCQRGGVRGDANQNTSSKRMIRHVKRYSNDEAAALRKNHVVRPMN